MSFILLLVSRRLSSQTYQCSCPQWRSWASGNPDQRSCTAVLIPWSATRPQQQQKCTGRNSAGIVATYPSPAVLARAGSLDLGLGVQEDVRLLLERTLRLDGKLGGHLDDFGEFAVEKRKGSCRCLSMGVEIVEWSKWGGTAKRKGKKNEISVASIFFPTGTA